jgi:oligoendopeptidase F
LFETHNIRSVEPRTPSTQDGAAADAVIQAFNKTVDQQDILISYIYATVSTDSRIEQAQGLLSEMEDLDARISPLLARLADWVASLDANALKEVSNEAREGLQRAVL